MGKTAKPRTSATSAPVCAADVVHLAAVKRAKKAAPSDEALGRSAELFSVLSSETRLRILLALGSAELCVCDLAQVVGQSVSAISHQLRSLRQLGLVKHRSQGKLVFYSLGDTDLLHMITAAQGVGR